mgnify:CR=1 FL=1
MFWPFKKLSSREKVTKILKKHIKALLKNEEFVRVCMEYWFSLKDDENYKNHIFQLIFPVHDRTY